MRLHLAFHFLDEASEWLHVPYPAPSRSHYNLVPGQRLLGVCNDSATRYSDLTWTELEASLSQQRCIVPVNGFYLWTEAGVPHYVSRTDRKPLFVAARWEGAGDARRGMLLTASSAGGVEAIQPRMPLLLRRESWRPWLSRNTYEDEAANALLAPDRSVELSVIRVRELVNDPANDRRECLLPV